MDPIARAAAKYRAYRIEKISTNRLVVVVDPLEDGVPFIHCVGGAQPPNVHQHAEEIFYILKGHATAHCGGQDVRARAGRQLPGSARADPPYREHGAGAALRALHDDSQRQVRGVDPQRRAGRAGRRGHGRPATAEVRGGDRDDGRGRGRRGGSCGPVNGTPTAWWIVCLSFARTSSDSFGGPLRFG
jgi:hypothetical protein